MKVTFTIVSAMLLSLALANPSCIAVVAEQESPDSPSPLSAEQYLVSPRDVLQITIVLEADLPLLFPVSESDGKIKFPYIEYVRVEGLTVTWIERLVTALLQGADQRKMNELMDQVRSAFRQGNNPVNIQRQVTQALSEVEPNDCWYKNPQVNVMVVTYSQKFFYVEGYVNKPGQYSFTGENMMTVYRAIIRAGGFKNDAKKTVRLITTVAGGEKKTIEVDVNDVIKKNAPDPPIRANDVIRVDPSFW